MKIRANGLEFNVVVEGEGQAVVLLHGFPDRAELWRKQVPALVSAGYRVIAPDMRGFGDSDKPEGVEHYSVLHLTEDLRGILDELGIDKTHIVGHDIGTVTAWLFATLYPERVTSLTALSLGHPGSYREAGLEQLAMSWYAFMFQFEGVAEEWLSRNDWEFLRSMASDDDTDRRVADLSRPGALTAALGWHRANMPPSSWIEEFPDLPPVSVPTMGIWSSKDHLLGEDQMKGSEKFVTGPWRYERMDGVGHWIPLAEPDRLNELLLDFISRV